MKKTISLSMMLVLGSIFYAQNPISIEVDENGKTFYKHQSDLERSSQQTNSAPESLMLDWGSPDVNIFLNRDRKSTRLNSSHVRISYAVFCLKKKIIYSTYK